jgi:hypothetical protein
MKVRAATQTITIVLASLLAFLLLGWIGLQIKPSSFPTFPQQPSALKTVPMPSGLPAPVERFYRQLYGDNVPVIESAVLAGHATMRVGGITFPGRFRFTHDAGKAYRHYIEATVFGLPLMKINEHFLNGKSRLQLPFGVSEGSQVDQGANLALWAESIWLPSLLIIDERVRWQAIDKDTALLVVPFAGDEQSIIVRFDPESGMLHLMESMRYKDATSINKTLWLNEALGWVSLADHTLPAIGAVTWFGDGKPWAVFHVNEVIYNVDVQEYIQANGP